MRRRSPAGNILIGAAIGGAVARSSANKREQRAEAQYQQQQLQQAQIAQAQAEAKYANAQAQLAQQQLQQQYPVAQPVAYAQPPQQQHHHSPPLASPGSDLGKSMINQALGPATTPSTQELLQLQHQLQQTQAICQQALALYNQSMALNQKAQHSNLTGNVVGNLFNAPVAGVLMDQKRNAKMRASLEPAERASQMLVEGFRRIPDGLRVRYPKEMSRVGNVPAARLKVGSFGRDVLAGAMFGQTGSNVNDVMMAKRIADNQREIGECIQVVREQIQLMQIVQARLEQDILFAKQQQAPVAVAVPSRPAAAVPVAARVAPPPPPARAAPVQLVLRAPHIVDELAMAPYGIISVPQGAIVTLVAGTLDGGLGGNYRDYIEVNYQGKVGKISRLIVSPVSVQPPPALF